MLKTIKSLTRFSFGVVFVGALALVSSQAWAICPTNHAALLAALQVSVAASNDLCFPHLLRLLCR